MNHGLALDGPARNLGARSLATALALFVSLRVESQPSDPKPQAVQPVDFTVSYEAPTSCPFRDEFIREIQTRSRIAVLAGLGQAPDVVVVVRIATGNKGFRGELELTAGLVSKERKLTSNSCKEVVSALALVTALAIDPNAETRPIESLPVPKEIVSGPPVGPPVPPIQIGPAPPAKLDAAWWREPDVYASPLPAWVVRPAPTKSRWRAQFGVNAATLALVSDEPLFGLKLAGGVARLGALPFELEAGFVYLTTASPIEAAGLDARLELLLGSLEGCVPGLRFVNTLRFFPCLSVAAGAARATFTNGAGDEASGVGPWLGVRPSVALDWLFASPVGLELQAGPMFPVVQTEFANDSHTIVEGGPAGVSAEIGLFAEF